MYRGLTDTPIYSNILYMFNTVTSLPYAWFRYCYQCSSCCSYCNGKLCFMYNVSRYFVIYKISSIFNVSHYGFTIRSSLDIWSSFSVLSILSSSLITVIEHRLSIVLYQKHLLNIQSVISCIDSIGHIISSYSID